MLRNKTLEFKQRYSKSPLKNTNERSNTPKVIKDKLCMTGFSNTTTTNSTNQRNLKKMAKVQSSAFLRSRTKVDSETDKTQIVSRKFIQNDTSLCRYLYNQTEKIEKTPIKKYKMALNEEVLSQTQEQRSVQRGKHIVIRQIIDANAFFNNLTPRSLFFCCKCFKYIFAIEKNLHYPKCENSVRINELTQKQKQQIGWEKLDRILELSLYTKCKQETITTLYSQIKKNKIDFFDEIQIGPNVTYLSFDEITEAFIYTYWMILKGCSYNSSGIFSMKKIFSCTQKTNQISSVFEKKFFQ